MTRQTHTTRFLHGIYKPAPLFRFVATCGLAALIFTVMPGLADETNARPFLHPDRIRYDSHCMTIDGKDVFLYSGAFHFFRCPKELWHDRFQKIKDAGFNCVETYVAWNWCEPEMPAGTNDFSKVNLTDLDDWLKMAEEFGLYVIVRPGPYICAEWDTGGYPQWLLTKQPAQPLREKAWLRSDDPVYLAWCKHWYDAVCPVIAKHQITRKAPGAPGVILVQLENEYDYARMPDDVMLSQVRALGEAARAGGIDVPLFTCWTHPVRGSTDPFMRQVFDACNFYPRWNVEGELRPAIAKLRREQPDAPLATTELQGGWFAQVGGKLSEDQDGVTAAQINNLTLFAIQNGETILNYYMLFGGTNPGDWAARDLTTTYDYAAPIREWGGVGDRYQRVWALGHMLREHGADLARSEAVDCDVTGTQKDVQVVERRTPAGGRYFFVRTSQHDEPREGTAQVREKTGGESPEIVFNYALEPFGSTVLYLPPGVNDVAQGEWLPQAAPAIERPADLPAGVTITSARSHADSSPAHWTKLKPGEDLAQAGVYGSGFVFYRAKISSAGPTNLLVEFPAADAVLATVNGQRAECVGSTKTSAVFALPAGASDVQLLYENRGHVNGGNMAAACGISAAHFTSGTLGAGRPITGWRMHEVGGTSKRPEIKTDFKDDDWTPVDVATVDAANLPADHKAVYRAGIEVTASDLTGGRLILNFGRIDDLGWVYVNGKNLGETTDWSLPYGFDVTKELHPGHNVVAVIIQNNDGNGGLGAPTLAQESDGDAVPLEALGSPAGVEGQWWQPKFKDQRWATADVSEDADAGNDSMLTWYRMNFQLPAVKSGVWVPWHVRLNAAGNGFIYLNGHALGRYWEAGPQHDFFLPDCWLNFGKGRNNNLTLSLRPLDNGALIKSAVVEPYAGFAEKRPVAVN
jgi:hypothetical protein